MDICLLYLWKCDLFYSTPCCYLAFGVKCEHYSQKEHWKGYATPILLPDHPPGKIDNTSRNENPWDRYLSRSDCNISRGNRIQECALFQQQQQQYFQMQCYKQSQSKASRKTSMMLHLKVRSLERYIGRNQPTIVKLLTRKSESTWTQMSSAKQR